MAKQNIPGHHKKPKSASETRAGERIAKVMARAGLCSRRDAESWIEQGRVSVNGEVIASPAFNVSAQDRISIDGKPLPRAERTRLFLYNKPRGLVTTHADPEGRPTIFQMLPKNLPRLISIGRLDINTEGLLLLTNDGGLARALELPQTGWLRRYRVRANGSVMQPQLDALRKGITIDGIRYGEIEAVLDRVQGANVWLTFAIREGKNREVRNILEHLGLKVNRLIRVSYGPFQLGDLAESKVEEVRTRHLREQLGERLATLSGADFDGPINDSSEPATEVGKAAAAPRRQHEARGHADGRPAKDRAKPRGQGRNEERNEDRNRRQDRSERNDRNGRNARQDRNKRNARQDERTDKFQKPGQSKSGPRAAKSGKPAFGKAPPKPAGKPRRPPSRYKGKRDK